MKFSLDQAYPVEWEGVKGKSYSSVDDFAGASVIVMEVDGSHGKVKTTISDRVYYVFSGSGEFVIDDEAFQVKETDVVIVPKNTPYDYSGKMKVVCVHIPAFDPEGEVVLEEKEGSNE